MLYTSGNFSRTNFFLSKISSQVAETLLKRCKLLNDKNIRVSYIGVGKQMEITYLYKPFSKHYNKPVDHFLFLLAVLPYR